MFTCPGMPWIKYADSTAFGCNTLCTPSFLPLAPGRGRPFFGFRITYHPPLLLRRKNALPFGSMLRGRRGAVGKPERVDPCMEFHAAFMGFLDSECQRVPPFGRRHTAFAGKVGTPRLVGGGIHGIRHRPNLEHHRIQSGILQHIENFTQFPFLFFGHGGSHAGFRWPVDTVDSGHPGPTHLMLGGFRYCIRRHITSERRHSRHPYKGGGYA